ncbi:MAG: hypothetical protein GX589_08440 [Deltaproteobacteria bacterium]|nr:hypothetical protein [Deltaproteobacteria bacterium]
MNVQRVGGGVSAESRRCVRARSWRCESVGVSIGLRGREVVEREGNNAGLFYFYFLRRK